MGIHSHKHNQINIDINSVELASNIDFFFRTFSVAMKLFKYAMTTAAVERSVINAVVVDGDRAVGDFCGCFFCVAARRNSSFRRAVIVVLSGSYRRKRFLIQLNNSKMVRDRPSVLMAS